MLAVLLAAIMTFSLVACGGGEDTSADTGADTSVEETTGADIQPALDAFNAAADAFDTAANAINEDIEAYPQELIDTMNELADAMLEAKGSAPVANSARLADLLRRPQVTYADIAPFDGNRPELPRAVTEEVEIQLKYAGYIALQQKQVAVVPLANRAIASPATIAGSATRVPSLTICWSRVRPLMPASEPMVYSVCSSLVNFALYRLYARARVPWSPP